MCVTVYEIFLCRYTLKNTLIKVAPRTAKFHTKFNLVEGVCRRGDCRTLMRNSHIARCITVLSHLIRVIPRYIAPLCGYIGVNKPEMMSRGRPCVVRAFAVSNRLLVKTGRRLSSRMLSSTVRSRVSTPRRLPRASAILDPLFTGIDHVT